MEGIKGLYSLMAIITTSILDLYSGILNTIF